MRYQPHIDGLRAVAVLSVIFFHLDFDVFKGGFVGVDVFFVISGFLISTIIVKELSSTSRFSFSNFYVRRARRLLPALFATLALSFLFAAFVFSSVQLAEFGSELIYSTFSLANFYHWLNSGYFDTAAGARVLLHIWSLSVEEQFYLIWPLTMVFVYKHLSFRAGFVCGFLIFALSLAANIILVHHEFIGIYNQSEMMFYITPFRAYEFIIGTFGVWLIRRMPRGQIIHELLFISGLTAIGFSVVQFNSEILFPYYYALLPCLGALFIILAKESKLSKLMLENRVSVYIGLISYTLYLVHWPVIVFLKNYRLADLTKTDVVFALFVTLLVTLLIHYCIEKPLRFSRHGSVITSKSNQKFPNRIFLYQCAGSAVVLALLGTLLLSSSGLYILKGELYPEGVVIQGKKDRYDLIRQSCTVRDLHSEKCHNERSFQVLVIGNSHEPDGYNIFFTMFENEETINFIRFSGTNYCEVERQSFDTVISPVKKGACDKRVAVLNDLDFLETLDAVVYSSNRPFAKNKKNTWKLLAHITEHNRNVKLLVLGSYFNTKSNCADLANRFGVTAACRNPDLLSYTGNNELAESYKLNLAGNIDFVYLDKFKALCNSEELSSCPTEEGGEPMFYDQHHLSMSFAKYIAKRFSVVYGPELLLAGFPVSQN